MVFLQVSQGKNKIEMISFIFMNFNMRWAFLVSYNKLYVAAISGYL